MIIYHKNHVAAFVGNHTVIWMARPLLKQVITITSAAAPPSGPPAGSLALMGVGI